MNTYRSTQTNLNFGIYNTKPSRFDFLRVTVPLIAPIFSLVDGSTIQRENHSFVVPKISEKTIDWGAKAKNPLTNDFEF